MANEVTISQETAEGIIDQLLHGYADGHRLLQASRRIPDDLSRLILRMSDLSGSNRAEGFDEYITGYPLPSVRSYALAKTWYAPEMARPGCVWTHTILIPASVMEQIPSLTIMQTLFKRPGNADQQTAYSRAIRFSELPLNASGAGDSKGEMSSKLAELVFHHYREGAKPIVLPSYTSGDFTEEIFAIWSQQWPSLRMRLTFCTGSLSSRSYEKRPFDVQCVPAPLVREVIREMSELQSGQPEVISSLNDEIPSWAETAATDARSFSGGDLRSFLWSVTDSNASRSDFVPLVYLFDALHASSSLPGLIDALAKTFPKPDDGRGVKSLFLGATATALKQWRFQEHEILLELGRTSRFGSFDASSLSLKPRAAELCLTNPAAAKRLIPTLFGSALNPLGEQILEGLISAADHGIVWDLARERAELLPTLFRLNPQLATSPQLWLEGSDRRRELIDSLKSVADADLVDRVVRAILDSGTHGVIRTALDRWGKDATFAILKWTNSHAGHMWEETREALFFQIPYVMDWVGHHSDANFDCLVSIAHIVAPYSYQIVQYDSMIWLEVLEALKDTGKEMEITYLSTFVLALAFGNAPPAPVRLLALSFERVHEIAESNRMSDEAWTIMAPLVPELSRYSNWDKCERLRRALVGAFIRHAWPVSALKQTVKDKRLRRNIMKSVRKVDGGAEYFRRLHVSD
jgi:hypothetical protein